MHPTNTPQHGAEIAARMTPKARSERAQTAAMARHYSKFVPMMVQFLTEIEDMEDPPDTSPRYPTLAKILRTNRGAYDWLFCEARRAMGY